jgi:hypothetical protein
MSIRRHLRKWEKERVEFIFKRLSQCSEISEGDLDFVISIEGQYERDYCLSDAQLKVLEDIYARWDT